MHIVAQVNHRNLGVKVETNCLRDSDLIPRTSFLSNLHEWGFKVYVCLRVLWWLIKPVLALNCLNANRASQL